MQFTAIFTGKERDAYHFALPDHDTETDTHHAQFRQYSSSQGRWMSPDPSDGSYSLGDPQSFNRYSYARNNPLSIIDPTGLSGVCLSAFPYGTAEPDQNTVNPWINNSYDCASGYGTWVETGSDVTMDVSSSDPIADPGNGAYAVSPTGSN
jgi:RHS repeat-associated protein